MDAQKGRKVNKKAEDGSEVDNVRVIAIDKSYNDMLSTSPLKHRPAMDLYGTPERNQRVLEHYDRVNG